MSFTATELNGSKVEQYQQLTEQARGLVFEESNLVANAAVVHNDMSGHWIYG